MDNAMAVFSVFPKRTITLDVSSTAVRLLLVNGRRVEKWASAPIEPGLIEDGLIIDPPAFGAKVRRLMASSGIQGSKIVASVSGAYSVFRVLNLPEMDNRRNDDAVLEAAAGLMPVPVEELYISCQVVSDGELAEKAFVVGMPRNIVDAEIQALRGAGVNPHILNLKGLALSKLVDGQQAIIVNMEEDSIDIVLMSGGFPQIVRTVAARHNSNVEDRIDHLARTLWQTDSFLGSRQVRRSPDTDTPLFLAGPLADDPDVVDGVQSVTGHAVAPLAIPVEYPGSMSVSRYAVNVGLAVGEVATAREEEEIDAPVSGTAEIED
jgi:type IV pilus assembly protein PilM